jgi:hypothetical protein
MTDDWHLAPLPQKLFDTMHRLDGLANDLLEIARAGDATFIADDTASDLGLIERAPTRTFGVYRYKGSGIVDRILCRLSDLRDDAIDAALIAQCRERGWAKDCEAADDYSDELRDVTPTVDQAIAHWRQEQARLAA